MGVVLVVSIATPTEGVFLTKKIIDILKSWNKIGSLDCMYKVGINI